MLLNLQFTVSFLVLIKWKYLNSQPLARMTPCPLLWPGWPAWPALLWTWLLLLLVSMPPWYCQTRSPSQLFIASWPTECQAATAQVYSDTTHHHYPLIWGWWHQMTTETLSHSPLKCSRACFEYRLFRNRNNHSVVVTWQHNRTNLILPQ